MLNLQLICDSGGRVWVPLAAVLGSVSLGAALGLLPGPKGRWLGPIRSFALTASVAVVLTHLLPEAYSALGSRALLVFALGFALPSLVKALGGRLHRPKGARAGLELGYVGLLIHQVGDGLSMGALAEHDHGGHEHHDVVLALAAHTVPVVAMVVLAFGGAARKYEAGVRAVGLGLSAALGVVLGHWVTASVEQVVAWVAGVTAGLVLHVVAHDLRQSPPRGALERTLDLGAALFGAVVGALGAFGSGAHHHLDHLAPGALFERSGHFALDAGPPLLAAWVLAALWRAFLVPAGGGTQRAGWALRVAWLPRGAPGDAPELAAQLAAPVLSLEFALLAWVFLGAAWTAAALAGTALLAWVTALALRGPKPELVAQPSAVAGRSPSRRVRGQRALAGFVDHQAAWMIVGLLIAAAVELLLPAGGLLAARGLAVAWVAVLLLAAQVSAPAAVPIAAVLIAKGLPPSVALAALLLGSALRLRLLRALWRRHGVAAVGVSLGWGVGAAALAALSAVLPLGGEHARSVAHPHGPVSWLATALLLALVLSRIWRYGIRAWVSELRRSRSSELG